MLEVGAFFLNDIENFIGQPFPARKMDRQRHAGYARGAGGGTQGLALLRCEILADAYFADDTRHDLRLSLAAANIIDEKLGDCIDIHVLQPFRMGVLQIEAGAHDDLEIGHS